MGFSEEGSVWYEFVGPCAACTLRSLSEPKDFPKSSFLFCSVFTRQRHRQREIVRRGRVDEPWDCAKNNFNFTVIWDIFQEIF